MTRVLLAKNFLVDHLFFSIALRAGAAVRLITMLGFRPAIWSGGDSASYVTTAVTLFPGTSRVSGYGIFLFLLRPFPASGRDRHRASGRLAIAVFIYACCAGTACPAGVPPLAALPVLLDAYQIGSSMRSWPTPCWLPGRGGDHPAAVGADRHRCNRHGRPAARARRDHVAGRLAGGRPAPGVPAAAAGRLAGLRGRPDRRHPPGGGLPQLVRREVPPCGAQLCRRHLPVVADYDLRRLRDHQAARRRAGAMSARAGSRTARGGLVHLEDELSD